MLTRSVPKPRAVLTYSVSMKYGSRALEGYGERADFGADRRPPNRCPSRRPLSFGGYSSGIVRRADTGEAKC